jgi:hypothetical protein
MMLLQLFIYQKDGILNYTFAKTSKLQTNTAGVVLAVILKFTPTGIVLL